MENRTNMKNKKYVLQYRERNEADHAYKDYEEAEPVESYSQGQQLLKKAKEKWTDDGRLKFRIKRVKIISNNT